MNFNSFCKINMLLLCCLFMAACSKSSNKRTKTELISSSSWKYSQSGIDQDGKPSTIELAVPLDACITDNIVTFKSDKTGTVDEGATKCPPGTDPQTTSFTWSLSADESQITLSGPIIQLLGSNQPDFKIEVTDSKLILSQTQMVSGFPLPVAGVLVLVH